MAPTINGYYNGSELSGQMRFRIRTFPQIDLSEVEEAVFDAFNCFEEAGFTDKDIERIKAGIETEFYNGVASVLSKAFQLSQYNVFAGSPDFIRQDLLKLSSVKSADVWKVYNKYLKNRPYVMTSFVPRGKLELAAENSTMFEINDAKAPVVDVEQSLPEHSATTRPSRFDRSVEPPVGIVPALTVPEIWEHEYSTGLKMYGIAQHELPLINYIVRIKAGQVRDNPEKTGVANLISDVMMEGTLKRTPQKLEEAIQDLGASISMYTGQEEITLEVNTLASKLIETVELVQEILLEPRWDVKEFDRIKQGTIEIIKRRNSRPAIIADQVFRRCLYGNDHILGQSVLGDSSSVAGLAIDDLRSY